ncbi:MAG: DUF4097 family beta strand repeat-containing protein [Sciscionella sp.]
MRPGLAIGGVALIVAGAAIAFGWWWPKTAHADEQIIDTVTQVRIANDSGSVRVRTGDVSVTSVQEHFRYSWQKPSDRSYSVDGGTLRLGGCGRWCSVDYVVLVPKGASVSGHADSGDITVAGASSVTVRANSGSVAVRDVSGSVEVQASSGHVTLDGVGGDVSVTDNSGTVSGTRLAGRTDVTADSGDVTLAMAAATDVKVVADSGTISLVVPRAQYRVEVSADSGTSAVTVPRDPSSPHLLDLTADSGDVTATAR